MGRHPSLVEPDSSSDFKLVGSKTFIRSNPRSDRFGVKRVHHVEFWCGDATNCSQRFSWGLGMPIVAKSDLSTGNLIHASYLLRSGDVNLLFTAPYSIASHSSTASIPSFSSSVFHSFASNHGLAVRAIALEVDDASKAFSTSVANGGIPVTHPVDLDGRADLAEVQLYGDVVLRYISYRNKIPSAPLVKISPSNPNEWFLPGFAPVAEGESWVDFGIRNLDHAVGNVPSLGPALSYVKRFTGFHEFAEFTAEEVRTSLNSAVLANNEETVLMPINEPVYGTKSKSQVETFLEHNKGAGVQHLGLLSEDIFLTVREMRKRSGVGGFEFMPSPPHAYYTDLKERVGDVLTDQQVKECEDLGIVVEREDQGTLLQIFTKPVGDRPTVLIEIIQRIGCMVKDEQGRSYQKSGCGGFGKGNIEELFKSVGEYEKTLQPITGHGSTYTS